MSVSVVIPTYNGARYVREALASVFAQTLMPTEIVVVDDASTDGTPEIVAAVAQSSPIPVRLIRLQINSGGPARPLNVGVGAAFGECIAVLDQDDVFHRTKLEEQASLLASDSELTFVMGCCANLLDVKKIILPKPEVVSHIEHLARLEGAAWKIPGPIALRLLVKYHMFAGGYPGFVFRRRDWLRKGGADERWRLSSDFDFVCWLAHQGSVGFFPRIQYFGRTHDAKLSNNKVIALLEFAQIRAKYLRLDPAMSSDPHFGKQLRDEFLGMAYRLRQAGYHDVALDLNMLTGKVWGWDRETVMAATKVIPHRFFFRPKRLTDTT